MSGLSLVARIKELAYLHDGGHAYKLESVLADVRELEHAAREAHDLLHGVEGISRNNLEQLAHEASERLTAILTKCSGSAKEPTGGS